MYEMHNDEWWMRVWDADLSPEESRAWEQHLQVCDRCRREWEALLRVDAVLTNAPPPPPITADFTERTVQRIEHRQWMRYWMMQLGGVTVVSLVSLGALYYLGTTIVQLDQLLNVLRAGWAVLLPPLISLVVTLMSLASEVLPVAVGLAGMLLLLMMPNGILATVALLLFGRRRATQLA